MHYDVILVYPPVMKKIPATDPPFGLMYLAQALKAAGYKTIILDLNVLRWTEEEVVAFFKENTASVVGFSGMTTVYYYIKWLCGVLKKLIPETKLIGGGSFATPCPETVLRLLLLDAVMIGEGEVGIVQLVDALISGKPLAGIPNTGRLENGEFVQEKNERITDLDELPLPGYDFVDMDHYLNSTGKRPSLMHYCEQRNISIDTVSNYFIMFSSRGCPFQCSFCYRNFGNQVTAHSVDYVIDHINYVRERFGVNNIAFYDETFNVNRTWIFELCEAARSKLKDTYFWVGGARADLLDREVIEEMNNSGFYEVSIGVESFDDRILEEMGKGVTADQLLNALKLLKEYDMAPSCMGLLYGFPGDDEASLQTTVGVVKKLGIPGYFQFPLPFPGTKLYNELRAKGELQDEDKFMMDLSDGMTMDLFVNMSRYSDDQLKSMVADADAVVSNI